MTDPLKEHLAKLTLLSHQAATKQDIKHIASLIEKFSQSHSYQKKQPIVLGTLLFSAIIGTATFIDGSQESVSLTMGAVFIVSLLIFLTRSLQATSVGKEIFRKAIEIENELECQTFDGKKLWYELRKKFSVFNEGDEGQHITALYNSKTECGEAFSLFQFTYVEVKEEEETDSDGNTTKKTTRTTYHKYGLLSSIPNLSALSINAKFFKGKWNSASKKFNRMFRVRCESEMLPAKLFTPSVILEFEERFKALKAFEANNEEQCFVFSSKIMPSTFVKGSIKKTSEFIDSLESPPKIAELQTAKELISYINSKVNKNLKKVS
ncbi:hypothetical protein [Pseudoalteromonas luteoviolacea]|uniref:DUF3137 domain-containing protein n=1 Tax=Pseudoalteromonas luteoviolacea NCIMB 1942 TaxID=1365253 RepID=A0A167I129_9GAMM|nr:hypothetical protein [Pseudoalteromonas luteoviolacea]KZN58777.1 hypothetical protein N482_04105 [Pseudoalteromonas luteoviolacea NCIMB 1942]